MFLKFKIYLKKCNPSKQEKVCIFVLNQNDKMKSQEKRKMKKEKTNDIKYNMYMLK